VSSLPVKAPAAKISLAAPQTCGAVALEASRRKQPKRGGTTNEGCCEPPRGAGQ